MTEKFIFTYKSDADLVKAMEIAESFDAIYDGFVPGENGYTNYTMVMYQTSRDPEPYTSEQLKSVII